MAEKTVVSGGGVSFLGLLAIVFIACKLCGVISWPWLWVLAPLWGPIALACVLMTCVCAAIAVAALVFAAVSAANKAA